MIGKKTTSVILPYVNQGLMDCARKQMSDDRSPATASPIRTDAAPAAYIRCNIVGLHCRHYLYTFCVRSMKS
jgi:hypothetical protein